MIPVPEYMKALIFDCDGTLADSMPLHLLAWQEALEFFGEKYDESFLDDLKGMNEEHIVDLYNKKFNASLDPKKLVDRKHEFYLNRIESVKPIEPVIAVVHRFAGKLPMAVVSGGRRNSVHKTLQVLQISDKFRVVLTADDPIPPKPAPDIFLEAANLLKVDPGKCQVFEDGDVGLQAARKAGMPATDIRPFLTNK